MSENFGSAQKRGAENKLAAGYDMSIPEEKNYLYDSLEDPRRLVPDNETGFEPAKDPEEDFDSRILTGDALPPEHEQDDPQNYDDPTDLAKMESIRQEISRRQETVALRGPEEETRTRPDTAMAAAVEKEAEGAHEDIKIPKKVHDRMMARISKFLSKNVANPNLQSDAAIDVISGLGLKEDSPYYSRLMREAGLLLGIKNRNTRDENRLIAKAQKEFQEDRQDAVRRKMESRKAAMDEMMYHKESLGDSVRQNQGDIRWIDEIKDYIKEMGDDPETISRFWESFEYIYQNRTTRNGEQFESADLKRMENGAITEIAAENLFLGWKEHIGKESESESKIRRLEDLKKISFFIEKATPEEDATKKTDFFVCFMYDGEKVSIPVQVKSDYFEEGWSKEKEYREEDTISFHDSPRSDGPGNRLDIERTKFFKENNLGLYVMLSHGHHGLGISISGEASDELKTLFNKRMESVLPGLLNKIDNMKILADKERQ